VVCLHYMAGWSMFVAFPLPSLLSMLWPSAFRPVPAYLAIFRATQMCVGAEFTWPAVNRLRREQGSCVGSGWLLQGISRGVKLEAGDMRACLVYRPPTACIHRLYGGVRRLDWREILSMSHHSSDSLPF